MKSKTKKFIKQYITQNLIINPAQGTITDKNNNSVLEISKNYYMVKIGKYYYHAHRIIYFHTHNIISTKRNIIHHINENTLDNRISNLKLLNCKRHHFIHIMAKKLNISTLDFTNNEKAYSKQYKDFIKYITPKL